MNVYLVGMPGSGKSSVGRALASRLKLPFVDLDEEVERQSGRSIPELFSRDGEAAFRLAESRALASVGGGERAVVACGGGIVLDPSNRALLVSTGTVVYLGASLDTLRSRVGSGEGRPLLARPQDLERLLRERAPVYEDVATIAVESEDAPEAVAAGIAEALGSAEHNGRSGSDRR